MVPRVPDGHSCVCLVMPSTVIKRFEYRPKAKELEVTFVTGRRYVYFDVPVDEADQFRSAFSKGTYFNRRIRNNFRCAEMETGRPSVNLSG